jgi:3-oxoacyl-[acyl-carrier-protein] synthase II
MTGVKRESRVVITGCGTINALGRDVQSSWDRLVAGRCGIGLLSAPLGGGPVRFAAAVSEPLPGAGASAISSRTARLALAAAEEAARQARLSEIDGRERVGVIVGTTTGGIRETEDYFVSRQRGRPGRRSAIVVFEKAGTSDLLATRFGLGGPRFTLHTACASGASAIVIGAELIRGGYVDAVIAGGADALARMVLSGFHSLRVVAPEPCRPFDRSRCGLSLGEGAGMMVLERESRAVERGAEVLAVLLGGGQSTDAHHLTAPAPDGCGAARAIRAALARANVAAEAVDHVNAHGTGTLLNDAAEAASITAVLGKRTLRCPVTSIKGSIGHTLGAAGAIEAVVAVQTLRTGLIPPTVGLREPDPEFGLDVVQDRARREDVRVVVSNSFGFGGANAVLCLGRADYR